uniref:Collagen, type VI, alpha n=1 Tax=Tetraselmis sp. GSL018 TaxID=582737 RepID=A0A061R7R1_9CHLO|mmetsp:Transcript_42633/g.101234  ORF Transcript_42633/g.101234 Transcript_42633/m.101234 type:complete len:276 (+) Transcript_42633:181-1008(+)|eukprot:CAMPEP_0177600114 /NCGR_PEP_ID=MMETSP0419_2-20121207/13417_1 /TAXON_ID=582737 /ORGANISM="Tetraselmis sp., Strain GSL018" /LENGTH=275 /DNA_ID=CAMNT_0019093019 /DNA_START=151 /DNA_END=978 /DNA_ORIENTATION=+
MQYFLSCLVATVALQELGQVYTQETTGARPCPYASYELPSGNRYRGDYKECLCSDGEWLDCTDVPQDSDSPLASSAGCFSGPLDVVFLLDTSFSVTEDFEGSSDAETGKQNWSSMKKYVQNMVNSLALGRDATRVGLARFSDDPVKAYELFGDRNSFDSFLDSWTPELKGQTYLGKALDYVQKVFDWRIDVRKVIIVVTDGEADDDVIRVGSDLRNSGFELLAVGVGQNVNLGQLVRLTGTSVNVLRVDDFGLLLASPSFLRNALCTNSASLIST